MGIASFHAEFFNTCEVRDGYERAERAPVDTLTKSR